MVNEAPMNSSYSKISFFSRTEYPANGLRYAPSGVLVGGTRQRFCDGTNFKSRKLPENAHAVPTGSSPTTTVLAFAQESGARIVSWRFALNTLLVSQN